MPRKKDRGPQPLGSFASLERELHGTRRSGEASRPSPKVLLSVGRLLLGDLPQQWGQIAREHGVSFVPRPAPAFVAVRSEQLEALASRRPGIKAFAASFPPLPEGVPYALHDIRTVPENFGKSFLEEHPSGVMEWSFHPASTVYRAKNTYGIQARSDGDAAAMRSVATLIAERDYLWQAAQAGPLPPQARLPAVMIAAMDRLMDVDRQEAFLGALAGTLQAPLRLSQSHLIQLT